METKTQPTNTAGAKPVLYQPEVLIEEFVTESGRRGWRYRWKIPRPIPEKDKSLTIDKTETRHFATEAAAKQYGDLLMRHLDMTYGGLDLNARQPV